MKNKTYTLKCNRCGSLFLRNSPKDTCCIWGRCNGTASLTTTHALHKVKPCPTP